jgi:hypothetical protein
MPILRPLPWWKAITSTFFGLWEADSRPMLLTRIPLDGLDAPAEHLQYLSKSGNWKTGLTPVDAMPVMKHGNSEMTVRYHPELKKWIAVLSYPKLFSDKIVVRSASQLAGPWSKGKVIYRIAQMQKGKAGYDKDIFWMPQRNTRNFADLARYFLHTFVTR